MMQPLCRLRRWLRALEPRARQLLDRSWLAQFQPWLEQRALFRFQRQPLARGVAAGMFCGLIPGPLQIPGTLLVCAWLRGNVVAGGVVQRFRLVSRFVVGRVLRWGGRARSGPPAVPHRLRQGWKY